MGRREREREMSNIRKMLVCGHVRREGLLGDLEGWRGTCACVCGLNGGVGQRPESTKPMLEIMHTPSSRRAARGKIATWLSRHFSLFFFARRRFPRTIDWRIIPVGARVPSLSCNIPGVCARARDREIFAETSGKLTVRSALVDRL